MNPSILIPVADIIIIISLCVVKTVFFLQAARKRTLGRWFYFSRFDVIDASSQRITTLRARQNILSVMLLVLVIFSAVLFYLIAKILFELPLFFIKNFM